MSAVARRDRRVIGLALTTAAVQIGGLWIAVLETTHAPEPAVAASGERQGELKRSFDPAEDL